MAVLRIFRWHQLILLIFFVLLNKGASGISCYMCSSKNGSDTNCDDPYHPAHSKYAENCLVPKEDHIGEFPANYCVKISGVSAVTGESLMIRTCVLENMDSQCGVFKFGDEQLKGCILTCEYDGCNPASRSRVVLGLLPLLATTILLLR
ncbi:U-scoloptoxin(05)-Sm1a-like isoform X1 [Penaeus indicus]|uniref:U-scoloptoxin(05)-Sm1a-like isoform X1 n=1 Tax=Penaeus indicus TaxID=29960 RepID=UPI00300D3151